MVPKVYRRRGAIDPRGSLRSFKTPIELWIDTTLHRFTRKRYFFYPLWHALSRRKRDVIAVLVEPSHVNDLKEGVIKYQHRFKHVLTFDDDILRRVPNASLMPYGTTWIGKWPRERPKRFETSFLCGPKLHLEGHLLRHEVWYARRRFETPIRFFISRHGGPEPEPGDPVLGRSKWPLFESQFHICVENCRMRNYFTEKIMDCFRTYTVPVYWGCTNIGDYFDTKGIVAADSLDEIVEAVNSLTPETYASMRGAIEENRRLSERYADYAERLNQKLVDLGYESG